MVSLHALEVVSMCPTCTHILNNAHQYNLHTRHADILYNSAVILNCIWNLIYTVIASEASFLVSSMARIFYIYIYIYICFRPYIVP